MTDNSVLDRLERDVEQARGRLADDLARLRDPQTRADAKTELFEQADSYRDEFIGRIRGAASDHAQSLAVALRQRAEENPAAVAAIGAGIVWHLWKRPPVTTLLVGAGLASLLVGTGDGRTVPGTVGRIQEVNRLARDAADRAAQIALETREQALDLAAQTREIGTQAAQGLSDVADRTVDALSDFADDQREQIRENPLAMGIAAVALGAALGVVMSRRD